MHRSNYICSSALTRLLTSNPSNEAFPFHRREKLGEKKAGDKLATVAKGTTILGDPRHGLVYSSEYGSAIVQLPCSALVVDVSREAGSPTVRLESFSDRVAKDPLNLLSFSAH